MNIAKSAAFTAVFLFGMLVCEYAWADQAAVDADEYAKMPVCTLSADGKSLAVEPCRTAPAKSPMPRRPVPQIIQRMPQTKPPPKLAMPTAPPLPVMDPLVKPPVPTTSCDAAGCYGANGVRYNNFGAGSVVAPSGKVCSRSGSVIQC
ncbi:hypothetical protein SAMN05216319_3672 [Duganella sp. CF402]|uniref:hypothetical protein n=1 Tax=unclassified Duganella TaxID=2636909 RepID=UPI0008D3BAA9|nr:MULTISPECIES: hypothetical protein [unclassified Duganella]RZT04543.1 hypothetical protein EV582_5433 [Duganella sp. BK701]SEM32703.1 hypothetical protein SAMN05216319_3672 [Duganella sp. CF402]